MFGVSPAAMLPMIHSGLIELAENPKFDGFTVTVSGRQIQISIPSIDYHVCLSSSTAAEEFAELIDICRERLQ